MMLIIPNTNDRISIELNFFLKNSLLKTMRLVRMEALDAEIGKPKKKRYIQIANSGIRAATFLLTLQNNNGLCKIR